MAIYKVPADDNAESDDGTLHKPVDLYRCDICTALLFQREVAKHVCDTFGRRDVEGAARLLVELRKRAHKRRSLDVTMLSIVAVFHKL